MINNTKTIKYGNRTNDNQSFTYVFIIFNNKSFTLKIRIQNNQNKKYDLLPNIYRNEKDILNKYHNNNVEELFQTHEEKNTENFSAWINVNDKENHHQIGSDNMFVFDHFNNHVKMVNIEEMIWEKNRIMKKYLD